MFHKAQNIKPSGQWDFSQFDAKRIAIVLHGKDASPVFRGTAFFQRDPSLGNILRVKLDNQEESGNADFVISEAQWRDRIIPDVEHGCDFCFIMTYGK